MKYIILFLLLFFFASFISSDTAETTVTFHVIDSCRAEVIPFATVVLSSKDTTIEAACRKDGLCRLVIKEGTYKLRVFSIGYVGFEKKIVIKGPEAKTMIVGLKILCQ